MADPPGGGASGPERPEEGDRTSRTSVRARLSFLAPWLAVLLLGGWITRPSAWWLVPAAVAAVLPLLTRRRPDRVRGLAFALLLLAIPTAFLAHLRVQRLASDWEGYWSSRETSVYTELTRELENLVVRGDEAVRELVEATERAGGLPAVDVVTRIRDRSGLAALAVYDPAGDPVVWDGTHRGRIPQDVQDATAHYIYGEGPLFSYLYFTERMPETGSTAMVVALLRSDLPEGLRARPGDFVTRFRERSGEHIRIARSDRAGAAAAFDFVWDAPRGRDTLFSVSVVPPVETERVEQVRLRWLRVVMVLVGLAWVLLALAARTSRREIRLAMTVLLGLSLMLPLGPLLGGEALFRRVDFLLRGPGEVTLGRILAVLMVMVAWASLLRDPRPKLPVWGGTLCVLAGFPLVVALLGSAPSPGFLAGAEGGWVVYQLVVGVALSLTAAMALVLSRVPSRTSKRSWVLAGALAAAVALAGFGGWWLQRTATLPLGLLALWAAPTALAAWALATWRGWRRSIFLWVTAGVLGGTAALPFAWEHRLEARMRVAEDQLRRMDAEVDPYLDFLLSRLARRVNSLQAQGAGPVEMLYRGWLESGIAEEGYPVWLTVWSPTTEADQALPGEQLRIGVTGPRPAVAANWVDSALVSDSVIIRRFSLPDAHYLVSAPLPDGSVLTGVVPPLKEVTRGSPLGPLFGTLSGEEESRLTLVPLLPEDLASGDGPEWVRTDEGWRAETLLSYPDQRYHAHYLVDLAGAPVLVARGTLLLVLTLAVVLSVWFGTRLLLLRGPPGPGELRPLLHSFRTRITLALFGFFVLSNAIFGTLAYRTISGAAERAARVLAERVAQDAASIYNEVGGEMELLARQVGAELLEYRRGELREGSTEELVELGLFDAWLPFDVHRSLSTREEVLAAREERLGRWEYVTAFRRLPDADILAAPIPLQAGATAVRREEVAHLLAFAVVAGALLSFGLALLVGRALARPIHTLQVASERVGSGNLGVRLPTDRVDEFGSVFGAFNRMVRRLRRARRDLVRTTRRTQAIVEDAATGVIALDPGGRVTLANPRAAMLLDRELEVGERLRETGEPSDELVRWLELYYRDGLREVGAEFQFGDRRVRVRARRIAREGPLGGAVISLEDVTDELRAERILAWGEMARQVAHEVKNPLTPIKLSIQHIRRAWDDRRPEFGEILTRNADAALREIDRLASIASSFSRFGAPEAAGEAPLVAVRLQTVVAEVLTLYASTEGRVRFEQAIPEDLPPVRARVSEVKEVLVNLLENARAAVSADGRVRVKAEQAADGLVELSVRDDGSGIPPELLPRIFEPHFSTRSAGTGLGLAIVQRLADSWGATVAVDTGVGEYTEVTLRLEVWGREDPEDGRSVVGEGAVDGSGPQEEG